MYPDTEPEHDWCYEWRWANNFDPDTMDCNCEYYEKEI